MTAPDADPAARPAPAAPRGGFKGFLGRHLALRRAVNLAYAYGVHLLHVVLDLTPWFVRGGVMRLLGLKAGRHVFLDHRVYLKYPWMVRMGDHVSINRGVEFYPDFFGGGRIVLGSNVRVAPNVRLHAAGHDTADLAYTEIGGTITVGDDVWIGAGAILLPGVTVGPRSVVGAGSVVTRDVPADTVVAGVPARVIRQRDAEA